MTDFDSRFGGIGRLFGSSALPRLRRARVAIIGLGGVGSWSAEALARSGVGDLTLIDLDEICVSNVNRQLHALDGEIGRSKVDSMARRIQAIQPEGRVEAVNEFYSRENSDRLLGRGFDFVLDAIDSIASKAGLIAACRERGIPIVTVGGAGGRRDPSRVRVADLTEASYDRLLGGLRKELRKNYGFPRGRSSFGVDCVYSTEPCQFPQSDGSVCAKPDPKVKGLRLNCERGYGTASFVTGTFGFVAAAHVVARLSARGQS